MNKTVVSVLVAVVALLAIGGLVLSGRNNTRDTTTDQQTNQSLESDTDDQNQTSTTETTTTTENNESTTEQSASSQVTIQNFAFSPNTITVKKGTTVTWTNQDEVQHDITPDTDSEAFKGSELLSKGESYSFTFNTTGSYSYHCTPHPQMKGTIEVTE